MSASITIGIMYFNDHNPPHFHVRYDEYRALVGIEPLELRDERLPRAFTVSS